MGAIFTTIRVCFGQIWFADDHWQRLGRDVAVGVQRAADGRPDVAVRVTLEPRGDPVFKTRDYLAPQEPWELAPIEVSPQGDRVRTKTVERGYYDRARRAAREADDALLMLADQHLLECTVANVFLLCDGQWRTPPNSAPILAGIVRKRILQADVGAVEASLTLADARSAEAVVVTNALMIAHPVKAIRGVGEFESGRLARRLRDAIQP